MEGEFTDQLKKMTRTEGRISHQVNSSGKREKQLLKISKNSEVVGRLFGTIPQQTYLSYHLKTEYHPESENEDYLIEDVLAKSLHRRKTNTTRIKTRILTSQKLQQRRRAILM